jgi:hypothetical protein
MIIMMANSMNVFDFYLVKSAIWLTGFAITFLIFFRNERYFQLNRIYLISGIIASIIFPFYTWHYSVIKMAEQNSANSSLDLPRHPIINSLPGMHILWWVYAIGICLLIIKLLWQTMSVFRKLRKTGYEFKGSVKLVRTLEYSASFSFFSYVFVHSSTSDIEVTEIVNHEREHIKQNHWFDLILTEFVCILQWFNPFVWIYTHLVKQNHEYLADERALQYTSNPALYKATLLNQIFDVPIISFANSFGYSLNRKRFKMMKKSTHSPFRKFKLLIVLPLIALVFYSFAKPHIQTPTTSVVQSQKHNLGNEVMNTNKGKFFAENAEDKQSTIIDNTENMHYSSVIESVRDNNTRTKALLTDTVITRKDEGLSGVTNDTTVIGKQFDTKIISADTTTTSKVRFGYRKELNLTHKDYNSSTHIGYRLNSNYKLKSIIMNGDSTTRVPDNP